MAKVQDHWTRKGVLERIDAVLVELGHNPKHLTPEILATVKLKKWLKKWLLKI